MPRTTTSPIQFLAGNVGWVSAVLDSSLSQNLPSPSTDAGFFFFQWLFMECHEYNWHTEKKWLQSCPSGIPSQLWRSERLTSSSSTSPPPVSPSTPLLGPLPPHSTHYLHPFPPGARISTVLWASLYAGTTHLDGPGQGSCSLFVAQMSSLLSLLMREQRCWRTGRRHNQEVSQHSFLIYYLNSKVTSPSTLSPV